MDKNIQASRKALHELHTAICACHDELMAAYHNSGATVGERNVNILFATCTVSDMLSLIHKAQDELQANL